MRSKQIRESPKEKEDYIVQEIGEIQGLYYRGGLLEDKKYTSISDYENNQIKCLIKNLGKKI